MMRAPILTSREFASLTSLPKSVRRQGQYRSCPKAPTASPKTLLPDEIEELTSWLGAYEPSCARAFISAQAGFGLMATTPLQPEHILLTIPMSKCISSSKEEYSIYMVDEFLSNMHGLRPWVSTLPSSVSLPWLYWTDEEIEELQDEDTIVEIYSLREKVLKHPFFQSIVSKYGIDQSLWALSLVHSRSFTYTTGTGTRHIWVPGVDLCNHSLSNPNARVQIVHSSNNCQGRAALEEIAPLDDLQCADESQFQLVVGADGIPAGDEITISYGQCWPNDIYLLFFGWCPEEDSIHDMVVLFQNVEDMARYAMHSSPSPVPEDMNHQRLVATIEGLDTRIVDTYNTWQSNGCDMRFESLLTMIQRRASEILESYPTSLAEDVKRLPSISHAPSTTALRYRIHKKKILLHLVR